ncbi:MAG: ABC transporter permease [bacterium]|nr:ABC transporter permease [bacterium]
MRIYSIAFILREAWKGLTRARISTFAAIGIIAFMLVLLGLVFYTFSIVRSTFTGIGEQLEIILYLKDNLRVEDREILKNRISAMEGVKEVRYVSKDEAWKRFKESFKGNKFVLEIMGKNPLPDSFEIKVESPEYVEILANSITSLPGVRDIDVPLEIARRINNLIGWIEFGGIVVVGVFIVVSLFVISNVIRLSFVSRIKELEIMQLVGATVFFIKGPFIFEGILCGFLGGILGVIVFNILVFILKKYVLSTFPLFSGFTSCDVINLSLSLILFGMVVGGIGSVIFLERHLKR